MILTEPLREYDPVAHIEGNGYNVDVKEQAVVYNQKPEDEDSAYLLQKIQTTSVPTAQADVVADQMQTWVCQCAHSQHRLIKEFVNGESKAIVPCKHVRKYVKQHERNEAPDGQATL